MSVKKHQHRLVQRIFLTVIGIITIVFILQFVTQNLLMNDLYVYEKTSRMEGAFDDLLNDLAEGSFATEALLMNFESATGSPVILLDGVDRFENDSFFSRFPSAVLRMDGVDYKVILYDYVDEENNFIHDLFSLSRGDKRQCWLVQIPGTDYHVPISLGGITRSQMGLYLAAQNTTTLRGQAEVIQLLPKERMPGVLGYQPEVLINELLDIWEDGQVPLGVYDYIEEQSGLRRVIYSGQTMVNGKPVFVLTLMTLETVQDTFRVLNSYFLLVYFVLLILSVVMVFYFTRWVTRPVLTLDKRARAIAHGDLSPKPLLKTGDELEMLSESLNRIGTNLSDMIGELASSNEALAVEAIKRQENEVRMRNMLSALSHEFKTPLGILSGFTEVLKDGVGDKENDYYLDSMVDEIDRLNHMVEETLELTRLEAGSYHLQSTTFNLSDLVSQVYHRMAALFEQKHQTVIFEMTACKVTADRDKLARVVMNLMGNANKYGPEASVIHVTVTADPAPKFSISNPAETFEEATLPLFWDRFYRGDKSRNRNNEGSGLGLAIVKNILELHGWRYGVYQADGQIVFYFHG